MIGREQLVAEAVPVLAEAVMVTLVGPPGVGKTRLLRKLLAHEDRVGADIVTVDLAAVTTGDPDTVAKRLLQALGDDGPGNPIARLGDALTGRAPLLVLDTCEHLTAPVASVVSTLFSRVPQVRVLAASRRRLGLPGEQLLCVPPLHPDAAVQLLVARAAAIGVAIDPADPDATRLCAQLGGLPLAINLAAGRLDVLSLRELLAEDLLALLVAGHRPEHDRHRSWRATLDWSAQLLTTHQRRLWAILSEFRGGLTVHAARAVCAQLDMSDASVLDLLSTLVHASLLTRTEHQGRSRYHMLEPIRRYGQHLMETRGPGQHEIRQAHADYYATQAPRAITPTGESDGADPCGLIDEADNLTAAVEQLLTDPIRDRRGLRLAVIVADTAATTGQNGTSACALLRAAVAAHPPRQDRLHHNALILLTWLSLLHGDPTDPDSARAHSRQLDSPPGEPPPAATLFAAGLAHWSTHNLRQALLAFDTATTASTHPRLVFLARMCAAITAATTGAADTVQRATDLTVGLDASAQRWAHGYAQWAEALAEHRRGTTAAAATAMRRALITHHDNGNALGVLASVWLSAIMAAAASRHADAAHLWGAVDTLQQEMGTSVDRIPPLARLHRETERTCRQRLGDAHFDKHRLDGQIRGKHDIVERALSVVDALAKGGRFRLTRREREVAELVALGLTNTAIAAHLRISPRTTETHLRNALLKANASNRAHLAALVTEESSMGTTGPTTGSRIA